MRRTMKNLALAGCWLTSTLVAQTRVDLQNQSKNVNLQAQPHTAPLKSGAVLPATCLLADLFFQTTAPAGTNIYGCTSTNNWSLEGGTGGTGGNLTIDLNGTVVGTRAIANFIPGAGILDTLVDTGSQINIQQNVDTGLILSRANHQSGQTLLCASASGSATTYTCAMTPTLTTYTTGMVLNWTPDVSGAGGPTTLNVDALGAEPVKLSDGATDPALGDVIAGKMNAIWFDGTVFRLMNSSPVSALTGSQPAASRCAAGSGPSSEPRARRIRSRCARRMPPMLTPGGRFIEAAAKSAGRGVTPRRLGCGGIRQCRRTRPASLGCDG